MATFVLVHGAWHGGWCWHKVVSRLEALGHTALAVDLPGMGRDGTPLAELTLELWNDALVGVLEAQPHPVVLVGHSRGGLNISMAAESVPDRIARLVYLCAFVPEDGRSLFDQSAEDTDSTVAEALVPIADGLGTTIRDDLLKPLFYGDCDADDVALARLCLKPEPMAALATPFHGTEQNFGRVPKTYVECIEDRAVSIAAQRRMAARCDDVVTLDTSHSPFFSAPDDLVEVLLASAKA